MIMTVGGGDGDDVAEEGNKGGNGGDEQNHQPHGHLGSSVNKGLHTSSKQGTVAHGRGF